MPEEILTTENYKTAQVSGNLRIRREALMSKCSGIGVRCDAISPGQRGDIFPTSLPCTPVPDVFRTLRIQNRPKSVRVSMELVR